MEIYTSADEKRQRPQQPAALAGPDFGNSMGSQQLQGNQSSDPYLSPNQQDLLLAALNSQANARQNSSPQLGNSGGRSLSNPTERQSTMNGTSGSGVFMSPSQAELDDFGDYSPDLDYLEGDAWDFDSQDLGGTASLRYARSEL